MVIGWGWGSGRVRLDRQPLMVFSGAWGWGWWGNVSEEAADPQRLEATSTPLITCVAGANAGGAKAGMSD